MSYSTSLSCFRENKKKNKQEDKTRKEGRERIGRYRSYPLNWSFSLYRVETDGIFRGVYLYAVLKYDVSIMKPETTDL